MIFWILTAIVAFFVGWWIFISWQSDFFYTVIGRILAAICELVVGAMAWFLVAVLGSVGLGYLLTPDFTQVHDSERGLVALATKDSVQGEFHGGIFASYGYIDGVRKLSYVTKDDEGGIRLGYVSPDASVIFEQAGTPHIITHQWERSNGWVIPWAWETANTYSLYVPEGSVVQGYEVSP